MAHPPEELDRNGVIAEALRAYRQDLYRKIRNMERKTGKDFDPARMSKIYSKIDILSKEIRKLQPRAKTPYWRARD